MENTESLILAAGSLGDALLTLPALRLLQSRSRVTVAGTSPYSALGGDLLGIGHALPLDPLLQKLLSADPLDSSTRDFFGKFKDVYVFLKEKDDTLLQKLVSIGGIQVHFPAKSFDEFLKEARWAAEYWLETVSAEPLPSDSPFRNSRLQISGALKQKGTEILGSLGLTTPLVIHPGSGSPAKNAPLSFFREAAERSGKESGKQVLVVWGEAEEKNKKPIEEAFAGLDHVKILPSILPLGDLAAVFSCSAAYLGNDSGVTQLASVCGLRTFAVFNSTDARIWGPQQAIILAALQSLYR